MQKENAIKLLGAVLAGGMASRFGSDKALGQYKGRPLIDIVGDALSEQVVAIVLCGRSLPGWRSLDDRPRANLGPLGGLCAALHHAQACGYDAVLSVASDVVPIPAQLGAWLAAESNTLSRAAVVKGQHLLGLWPTFLTEQLDAHLATSRDRSMYGWIAACAAVPVVIPAALFNINTPADLDRLNLRAQ